MSRELDLRNLNPGEPRKARATSNCRNPECRNGLTPGLAAVGGGNKAQPLFGAGGIGAKRLMRWAWVRCLACNAPDDARKAGAVYKHLHLSDSEIARRAELATSKAPYQPVNDSLGKLAGTGQPRGATSGSTQDSGKLAELLEQNKKLTEQLTAQGAQFAQMNETMSRLTMQVASLLEDNMKLRKELEAKSSGKPVPPGDYTGPAALSAMLTGSPTK